MLALYWHKLFVPYWPIVMISLLCFIIASAAGLAAPVVMQLLIDNVLTAGERYQLHIISVGIVILYLLKGLFLYAYSYTMGRVGNQMLQAVRQEMYAKIQSMDYSYFLKRPPGEMISLFTNDLLFIQQAVTVSISDFIVESLNVIAIMLIMIYFDWQLSLVTFATLPFIVLAISFFNKKVGRLGALMTETMEKVSGLLHHSLLSVVTVQSYNREEYEYQKFSAKIWQAAGEFLKIQRLNAMLVPLIEFLAAIGLTVIIWFGGRAVIEGDLTIGGMFAFLVYIINIPPPVRKIAQAYTAMKLGLVAWKRIETLYAQQPAVIDGSLEVPAGVKGIVEFEQVSFRYRSDVEILNHISFTAKPGEFIAIVGPSGAGKSSIANLLLRLFDPTTGRIMVDGVNIRDYRVSQLRRRIGFIQQEPILFNASIRENIRYGCPDATAEQVEQAARMASAHDFIMELPQGYDSPAGEMGGLLSGGQRQRIAIARALILQPAILLLDEPTASLDTQSEMSVMESIRQASIGRTTFIITHRLSTLQPSDRVIYLSGGNIAVSGTQLDIMQHREIHLHDSALVNKPSC
ncbi:ABC transporter ATP-binding protein [Acetonema longum]|uniref:Lipid A ABC exporter, fused ATPase and inner membrane subunits MsbA n=1 Tax=Acetonema longum DSM 6540 TaxID=1009370 RepID=F7NDU3_9FIRM|nr:ABC transporter ATP-binding protein [Acetonema longum]EGO65758.1 lipid A ABC exporter, fused ATPase and inner membrane subunits MsbA [Acetonema longum DSM 6540]